MSVKQLVRYAIYNKYKVKDAKLLTLRYSNGITLRELIRRIDEINGVNDVISKSNKIR